MDEKDIYLKVEYYNKSPKEMLSEYFFKVRWAMGQLFRNIISIPERESARWVETTDPEGTFWKIGYSESPLRFSDINCPEPFESPEYPIKE